MKNRLEHIREQVKNEKKVTVSELSKIYKVTEETIRRDLEKLEKEGFLTRTFGGAVLNSASQKEHIHFYKRTSINQKEKAKIAQLFKEVLDQKRTIAADASTTVMEAIRLLKANRNITVLSSSTEIFREMTGSEIHILSTGGVFNEDSLSLQGNLAKENIRRYHVDLALLSCKGLDMDKGIMDSSEREADVKTEMHGSNRAGRICDNRRACAAYGSALQYFEVLYRGRNAAVRAGRRESEQKIPQS